MKSIYLKKHELLKEICLITNKTIDFCILSIANLNEELARRCLIECVRILKDDGLLFIHGLPHTLPVLQTLFSLVNMDNKSTGVVGPLESISFEQPDYGDDIGKTNLMNPHIAEDIFNKFYNQHALSVEVSMEKKKGKKFSNENKANLLREDMVDKVYRRDIVEVLKNYLPNNWLQIVTITQQKISLMGDPFSPFNFLWKFQIP